MMQPNTGLLERFQQQDPLAAKNQGEERFYQAYSAPHPESIKSSLDHKSNSGGKLDANQIDPWSSQYPGGKLQGRVEDIVGNQDARNNWNAISPMREHKTEIGATMARGPLDLHPSPPNSSSISSPEDSNKTPSSYEQHYLRTSPEKDLQSYASPLNAPSEEYADPPAMLRQYQSYGEQPTFILPDSTPEYSIFVGDLSHDLTEEDLVSQFLQPSPWPASHPFAIAHAHAQQSKGFYGTMTRFRPAPFLSTKSAKIMKDPVTGISRGFGFVRFSKEEDCTRALVEMQGMVINSAGGQGRPLRVCTATPKNREALQITQPMPTTEDSMMLYHQLQLHQHRLSLPTTTSSSSPPRDNLFGLLAPALADAAYANPKLSTGEDALNASNNAANNTSAVDPGNTTVFVGGLSSLISEDTLKTFFAPFGEIIYVKIPPGKGCGFVQFVRKIDAERAIERMQGFPIGGGRIRLSWGRSQGDKAAAAAAQAVAQSAQINHLANLAGMGVLTPTQISQLAGASLAANAATAAAAAAAANSPPSTVNTDAGSLLRQLAAAMSSPTAPHSRERSATMQHFPAMEQQHRQAHQITQARQMTYPTNLPWEDNTDYLSRLPPSSPGMAPRWNGGMARDHNDDYLSSLLPSLNLGSNATNRSQLHDLCSQKGLVSPGASFSPRHAPTNDGLYRHTALDNQGSLEDRSSKLLKQSSIFSPFSPPVSPGLAESKSTTRETSPLSMRDQSGSVDKDTDTFNKYIEAQQERQQSHYQHLAVQHDKMSASS